MATRTFSPAEHDAGNAVSAAGGFLLGSGGDWRHALLVLAALLFGFWLVRISVRLISGVE